MFIMYKIEDHDISYRGEINRGFVRFSYLKWRIPATHNVYTLLANQWLRFLESTVCRS